MKVWIDIAMASLLTAGMVLALGFAGEGTCSVNWSIYLGVWFLVIRELRYSKLWEK